MFVGLAFQVTDPEEIIIFVCVLQELDGQYFCHIIHAHDVLPCIIVSVSNMSIIKSTGMIA